MCALNNWAGLTYDNVYHCIIACSKLMKNLSPTYGTYTNVLTSAYVGAICRSVTGLLKGVLVVSFLAYLSCRLIGELIVLVGI